MIPCLNPATAWLPEPEAFVRLAARCGFSCVEAGADHWAEWARRKPVEYIREFCAAEGCLIGHAGLFVNFREDEISFEADLARLPRVCELNRKLGVRAMSTWIRPCCAVDPVEYRLMHVLRLRRVAALLKDHGMRLGLEFVGPKTSRAEGNPFIHDMPGMLALCRDIDPAVCGLLLDSYHWYASGATVQDIAALKSRQVVHVHINDAHPGPVDSLIDMKRLLPGDGAIDLAGFLRALEDIGYLGPVSVETFDERLRELGPEEAARLAGRKLIRLMQPYL
jgi:sugar phosphate isomerase/epimerase